MIFDFLFTATLAIGMIPVAYAVAAYSKLRLIRRSKNFKQTMRKFLNFLIFLSFGLIILSIETFADLVIYPTKVYSNKKVLRNKIHLKKDINPTILELLRMYFVELLQKK